ncbi:Panacea domain-containing protein [uncultured Microbacterium sp.]|uniref:Panacea domain-containing protein n=1 Tax=uncultured Microbacterium sp. TaxID=191216 RepID=UPI0025ED200B|nr:type II toxin-antitoxin system antitoxin SocA domain-containing protein [uncultured Microbacterium sp.]
MTTVRDVAAYILRSAGEMTAMKLQKLCYYSQAWHLVWEEEPLFGDKIEAWANGPVAPSLYDLHRGQFRVQPDLVKNADALPKHRASSVDAVLKFYGGQSAWELSNLTHSERPWLDARGNLPLGASSHAEITPASMAEYYGSLT